MRFFGNGNQRAGFMGYIGGLATALALWGFSVEGWPGKIMQGIASLTITLLLMDANGLLGGGDD